MRAVTNGLALLPYGSGVHYDSEETRRPKVHELVGDGTLPTTHCTDDGVGLVYRGTELVEAVSELDGKGAYIVSRRQSPQDSSGDDGSGDDGSGDDGSGDDGFGTHEERLEPRRLPDPPAGH